MLNETRRRLPGVDIHGAAVPQHHIDIVIAAERVVPRQPVDRHRRMILEEGPDLRHALLVGTQHALGIDHTLWLPGGARRKQEFGDRVRPDLGRRLVNSCRRRDREKVIERGHLHPIGRVLRDDDLRAPPINAAERLGEFGTILHKYQAGGHHAQDIFQLAEILRHQRIRRRHRGHRHAHVHGAVIQQRVVDTGIGQDHHRPVHGQATVQYSLADTLHLLEKIGVVHPPPITIRTRPVGDKRRLRRLRRPFLDPVTLTVRIGTQFLRRAQDHPSAADVFDDDPLLCHGYEFDWFVSHEISSLIRRLFTRPRPFAQRPSAEQILEFHVSDIYTR